MIAAPGRSVILGAFFVLLMAACGPRRPAALQPPAIDIGALQRDVVAKLAGQIEIRPGLKIAARFTVDDRKEARAYLIEAWKKLGLDVRTQDYSAEGQNIFAAVGPGDPAAETIILGAHYDSVRNAPGANDNATGTALVTAAAARLSRLASPARRIIFVLFDEEERGMRGSRAFAQKLKDEGAKIHSVHTVDQMGWDKDGDRAVELELPYEGALEIYTQVASGMKPPIPLLTTQERGSDHSAFRRLGFKAVGLTEEYHHNDTTPYIHRPGDTAETVNFDYLASTTELAVRVWTLLAQGR
ncbi:MAG: M20/M25/M40 family metallo-hydrolase [Acidobacteriota bacterium]|nr:M20/M25/M40 family metallo-hydrolase [Acidobacteriota bacterium]